MKILFYYIKIPVSLAEKIKVKIYANQDDFVSEIQALPRL